MTYDSTFADIQQVKASTYTISTDEMERIDKHVFDYFGCNEAILQNSADEAKWDSYYEGKVETWAIQVSEGMNKMMFSPRAMLTNRITFTANRMQFMSAASKRNMVRDMTDRRLMTINEGREILQLPPVPGGDVLIARGEYKAANGAQSLMGGQLSGSIKESDFDLGGDEQEYNDTDGQGDLTVDE
jgi:hypothetical protein